MNAHVNYTNMTPEEEFRLNGTLSAPTIESLLDTAKELEDFCPDSAISYIEEASGCFPQEDFMETEFQEIRTIANRLRGSNKLQMIDLVERLEALRNEINQSAEYGADELRKAKLSLKK